MATLQAWRAVTWTRRRRGSWSRSRRSWRSCRRWCGAVATTTATIEHSCKPAKAGSYNPLLHRVFCGGYLCHLSRSTAILSDCCQPRVWVLQENSRPHPLECSTKTLLHQTQHCNVKNPHSSSGRVRMANKLCMHNVMHMQLVI